MREAAAYVKVEGQGQQRLCRRVGFESALAIYFAIHFDHVFAGLRILGDPGDLVTAGFGAHDGHRCDFAVFTAGDGNGCVQESALGVPGQQRSIDEVGFFWRTLRGLPLQDKLKLAMKLALKSS